MSKRRAPPKRRELLDAMTVSHARLSALFGRWEDSIPAPLRVELREADIPLLRMLIRAGRLVPANPSLNRRIPHG